MVNIEKYKAFLAVCDTMNFGKAGEKLHVTQAAVSKAVKILEAELGGLLFVRTSRGISLTPEGADLYNKVSAAMNLLMEAETTFGKFTSLQTGEIRIGISTVLAKILLVDAVREFSRDYPGITIRIVNGMTSDLLGMLQKSQLDFVIYNHELTSHAPANKQRIATLRYVFLYNKNAFCISDFRNDIGNIPLIAQAHGSYTREYMESYLKSIGIKKKPSIEVVSQELAKEMAKAGIGISFVYKQLADKGMGIIPCDMGNDICIASGISGTTAAATRFLEYVKKNNG